MEDTFNDMRRMVDVLEGSFESLRDVMHQMEDPTEKAELFRQIASHLYDYRDEAYRFLPHSWEVLKNAYDKDDMAIISNSSANDDGKMIPDLVEQLLLEISNLHERVYNLEDAETDCECRYEVERLENECEQLESERRSFEEELNDKTNEVDDLLNRIEELEEQIKELEGV